MRVLVTGGAGFIGSQFVRRLAEAGDEVAVLDKLTYAGNRANLEGVEHDFHQGDIADPDAVARAAEGCDAIVNFAAETHVDRSILGPAEFILTDVLGTQVLLDHARQHGIRHLQVSTDEVYGDIPLGADPCTEAAPIRASSPYSASKAGGDLQVLAYVRTYGVDALITRGANTYGPRQYPGEVPAALHHERVRGRAAAGVRRRQPAPRVAARRGPLRRHRARTAKGKAGEVYNVGGQERENLEVVRRILDLTGASPDLVRHVDDRPGHDRRYSLDSSKLRALGWRAAALVRRRRARRDRRLVPREPRVVGADQVRRVQRYYEQQYATPPRGASFDANAPAGLGYRASRESARRPPARVPLSLPAPPRRAPPCRSQRPRPRRRPTTRRRPRPPPRDDEPGAGRRCADQRPRLGTRARA